MSQLSEQARATSTPTATTQAERSPLWLSAGPAIFLLLWSLGFPIAKIATGYVDPMLLLATRFVLVLAVLLPLFAWLRPPLPKTRAAWGHQVVVGFLIQTLYFGLAWSAFALGSSAGTVALIVSLQPVLVALLAPTITGEVIGLKRWIGFALGLAGAMIVIVGRAEVEAIGAAGLLCAVGALFGMSGATLYEKRFGVAQHPVTANVIQYATGLVTTLPLAVVLGQLDFTVNATVIASLAYLVIGNSLIAITLLLAMIRRGEASRVSALFYLVPPGAALLSWLMIGERMPPLAWVGMAVAALGVALVRPGRSR